jgi:hypothetical protein
VNRASTRPTRFATDFRYSVRHPKAWQERRGSALGITHFKIVVRFAEGGNRTTINMLVDAEGAYSHCHRLN